MDPYIYIYRKCIFCLNGCFMRKWKHPCKEHWERQLITPVRTFIPGFQRTAQPYTFPLHCGHLEQQGSIRIRFLPWTVTANLWATILNLLGASDCERLFVSVRVSAATAWHNCYFLAFCDQIPWISNIRRWNLPGSITHLFKNQKMSVWSGF